MYRIGLGQDSHAFLKSGKKRLVLGGVTVSESGGLSGNSDTDVILHSLCNALSSAIGGDSLSTWSDKMCQEGIKGSKKYVEYIFKEVKQKKYKVENVSICIEAKKPRLNLKIINKIKESVANLLEVKTEQVGITFTSGEELTAFGQGKGIQSIAQALLHD
ncbi:2-C-methyl-D-erythritol 2,4-cyclodiphosphate synthase [Candidatus Curtissbacteria bacterium RIFCSPLOWO2_01_FULL_41_28]|nr:MAG: 2-C-methyl-D-erythritol 2,4-cyclodiphosphate synthase [Candidatus Curtissbacteria bacterium RIFCSPLOWO2_01_FULL_41_28]